MTGIGAFRDAAAASGIPADEVAAWLGVARVCVQLDARAGSGPVAGRIGGLPALPPELPWPVSRDGRALPFVAAIHCAAVPRDGVDVVVPESGTLLFFLDYERTFWAVGDGHAERDNMRVLHVPDGAGETPVPLGDDGAAVVTAYPRNDLFPSVRLSVPDELDEDEDFQRRVPHWSELGALAERQWTEVSWPDRETMIIGGHGFEAQYSAESTVAAELYGESAGDDREAEVLRDWRPLAQFGLPDPMHEYVNARFMIARADLAECRFDRVVSSAEFTE
ncbi:DUF1963 domain-containing protein [Actinoplanes sp. L3-i22]|uniref:DUF1963 domain-containing protein n=1 Tax=Actinoplanes sp. L3-i22 TaxID=2836373 RepID=UPI001C777697|nr:DUF1963 domain-containing protein [Actinoplanes sp. L3-i22]BCY10777.1 hypothetical protein L3i22_058650 [Actinoplanes sp. L3-i22]